MGETEKGKGVCNEKTDLAGEFARDSETLNAGHALKAQA
jgi:hypothetical protein